MSRQKKKLTSAQRAAKRKRRKETMIIFLNGRQKRVPRAPTMKELETQERMLQNADPIWLVQNEMWEYLHQAETNEANHKVGGPDDLLFGSAAPPPL